MGQPIPPGDNVPLYEGLDASWNDIVGALPEDKRAELAPALKSRIDDYEQKLAPWQEFTKSGIEPGHLNTALSVYSAIETNPRAAYEAIGKHLGITPQQAQQAVQEVQETIDEGDEDDPRIMTLQNQVNTLTQIALAKRQEEENARIQQEQDSALERELSALRKKYDDVDEQQVLMYMQHNDLSAEDAYKAYTARDAQLRQRRPAPMVMNSGGGTIPKPGIDPTKLDSAGTKSLVIQMLQQAAHENNRA